MGPAAGGGGVRNPGYWGVGGASRLHLTFYARSEHGVTLNPRVVGVDGETVAEAKAVQVAPGSSWRQYGPFIPPADSGAETGALAFELVITGSGGAVQLDGLSLPADAVAGLFRRDVFDLLAALKPLLRAPEDATSRAPAPGRGGRKHTIGRRPRSGHFNSAWGYWVGLLLSALCRKNNALPPPSRPPCPPTRSRTVWDTMRCCSSRS